MHYANLYYLDNSVPNESFRWTLIGGMEQLREIIAKRFRVWMDSVDLFEEGDVSNVTAKGEAVAVMTLTSQAKFPAPAEAQPEQERPDLRYSVSLDGDLVATFVSRRRAIDWGEYLTRKFPVVVTITDCGGVLAPMVIVDGIAPDVTRAEEPSHAPDDNGPRSRQ